MRTSVQIFLVAALVLLCALCINAQEELCKELYDKYVMLYQQGRYSEAAEVAEEALQVAEKTFGSNHPHVAAFLNNLAELYRVKGRYAEAEPLYKRALEIGEKALGPDHPHVATTCENMAGLYEKMGKEEEAEKLEARARKIRSNQ